MCIEDIINGIDQYFMVPEKYSQSNHLTIDYFFNEVLDDYNIVKCGNKKSIKQTSNFTYKVEFIDFQKNAMKYSVKLVFIPIEDNMMSIGKDGGVYACARVYRRSYDSNKGATHQIKTDVFRWKAQRIMEMGYKVPIIGALYRPWSLLNLYKSARNKK